MGNARSNIQKTQHIDIHLSTEPWELVDADAFVCPGNSIGELSQYPASRIKRLTGLNLEGLLAPHLPLAVGAALVTPAGRMRARYLIHVPNTNEPGGEVLVEDVARATAAVLCACEVKGFQSVAIPLMGAYESGIPAEEAARAIHSEFRSHRSERPIKVLLMARTPDEVDVFEMAIEGLI